MYFAALREANISIDKDQWLSSSGVIMKLAHGFCNQLSSRNIDDGLTGQLVKNLVFIGNALYRFPQLAVFSGKEEKEEPVNEDDVDADEDSNEEGKDSEGEESEEEEENTKGKAQKLTTSDQSDQQNGTLIIVVVS